MVGLSAKWDANMQPHTRSLCRGMINCNWVFVLRILDLGVWTLDFGYLDLDLDFKFWIFGFGLWILDFGFWALKLGLRISNLDFGI